MYIYIYTLYNNDVITHVEIVEFMQSTYFLLHNNFLQLHHHPITTPCHIVSLSIIHALVDTVMLCGVVFRGMYTSWEGVYT